MWHSKGTGRTDGRKLNRPSPLLPSDAGSIPSQSARSRALARAVDKPTTRVGVAFVAIEMCRSRETIVSRIGPRSAPSRWISSITTSATFVTYLRDCQLREMPSHFSGVATMMSALSNGDPACSLRELHQPLAELRARVFAPVLDAFARNAPGGGCRQSFPRGRRGTPSSSPARRRWSCRTRQAPACVAILVVERVKRLRLDGVEGGCARTTPRTSGCSAPTAVAVLGQ